MADKYNSGIVLSNVLRDSLGHLAMQIFIYCKWVRRFHPLCMLMHFWTEMQLCCYELGHDRLEILCLLTDTNLVFDDN